MNEVHQKATMRRAASAWTRWRSPPATGASLRNATALLSSNSNFRFANSVIDSSVYFSTTAPLQRARGASAPAKKKAAPARRKKSLLVDGNNALYHFYNPLTAADR